MANRRRELVKKILQEALERPREERPAYLDAACQGDLLLRGEVEALVKSDEDAGSFLSDPTLDLVSLESSMAAAEPTLKPGARIGRYKLLQEIGEGGFGVVYMAEQVEPVRRKVALKVIKLGMDTREVIARFEAERQALALMDHANIARVLDAGATETGRPYFVMELVKGIPITEYADVNHLDTTRRLKLFMKVCAAVQHAHQKGVIHRDLKPSNILVTLHDGAAVPKIIDFGVAKATNARLTEKTLFTRYRQFIGTPAYMSPEQAEMSSLDVDTRSDVYSLGVVLYELLTGATPFDTRQLLERGYAEIQRVIREVEPPTPSHRVSSMAAAGLSAVARNRHVDPRVLSRSLRGDLDWIVMRALEKDRTRRYGAASELARDVARHLASEPVEASPPSPTYRLQKLLRRHRAPILTAATVAVALLTGTILSVWGLVTAREEATNARAAETGQSEAREKAVASAKEAKEEAQRAREAEAREREQRTKADALGLEEKKQREVAETKSAEAQREAKKAGRVVELLQRMLGSANPWESRGRGFTVRELLDEFSEDAFQKLESEPEVEMLLRSTIADAYRGLGEHTSGEPHLKRLVELVTAHLPESSAERIHVLRFQGTFLDDQGFHDQAEPFLREALELAKTHLGADADETLECLEKRGLVESHRGRWSQGEPLLRAALEGAQRKHGPKHDLTIRFLINLGGEYKGHRRFREAEPLLREALSTSTSALGEDSSWTLYAMTILGMALYEEARYIEAAPLLSRVEEKEKLRLGSDGSQRLHVLRRLARCYLEAGEVEKAEPLLKEAEELLKQLAARKKTRLGTAHLETLEALDQLAKVYRDQNRQIEAEKLLIRVAELKAKILGNDNTDLLVNLETLEGLLLQGGEHSASLRDENKSTMLRGVLEKRLAIERQRLGEDHPNVLRTLNNIGYTYSVEGQFDEALKIGQTVFEGAGRLHGPDHVLTLRYACNLACALDSAGRIADSERVFRESLASARQALGSTHEIAIDLARGLGLSLWVQNRAREAESFLKEAVEWTRSRFGSEHEATVAALIPYALCLCDLERYAEALELSTRVLAARRASDAGDQDQTASALHVHGKALMGLGKYAEAEALLREGLEMRARLHRERPWRLSSIRGSLGQCVAEQRKLPEAESLLLEAHNEYEKWRYSDVYGKQKHVKNLIHLYELWKKPTEVARWKKKLAALEKEARAQEAKAAQPAKGTAPGSN